MALAPHRAPTHAPRPQRWPTPKQLAKLLQAQAQAVELSHRRPDLASSLAGVVGVWGQVPSEVRIAVRGVARRTAPSIIERWPLGGASLASLAGQEPADASVSDLQAQIRQWSDALSRAGRAADNLWTAANVAQTAAGASLLAASENPDAALTSIADRLRAAVGSLGWGVGGLFVAALVLLALWKS